jgi:hypothetical protein
MCSGVKLINLFPFSLSYDDAEANCASYHITAFEAVTGESEYGSVLLSLGHELLWNSPNEFEAYDELL